MRVGVVSGESGEEAIPAHAHDARTRRKMIHLGMVALCDGLRVGWRDVVWSGPWRHKAKGS